MWKKTQDLTMIPMGTQSPHNDTTESIIGPSVHLEGNFNSSGNIIIGGSLAGSLTTSGDVRVLESAKVQATIAASHVYIAGEIRGDVNASELLELSPTARLYGNVEVKVLSIAPGAVLHGKCAMKGGGGAIKDRKSEETKETAVAREVKNVRAKEGKDLSFLQP